MRTFRGSRSSLFSTTMMVSVAALVSVIVGLRGFPFPEGEAPLGEASPVFPGEWPLTFPRTEGGGRSPPHGGGRSGQGVVTGKKRKVRRAAVKAVFMPARQAALPRLPLDPGGRRCQGRNKRCGPERASPAGAQHPLDKRSLPGSAETAQARSVLRIERGRPERAVAPPILMLVRDGLTPNPNKNKQGTHLHSDQLFLCAPQCIGRSCSPIFPAEPTTRKPDGIERLYLAFVGFFASVRQQADLRLRGRPVGVVLFAGTDQTAVIARLKEATAAGVKNITPIQEA